MNNLSSTACAVTKAAATTSRSHCRQEPLPAGDTDAGHPEQDSEQTDPEDEGPPESETSRRRQRAPGGRRPAAARVGHGRAVMRMARRGRSARLSTPDISGKETAISATASSETCTVRSGLRAQSIRADT